MSKQKNFIAFLMNPNYWWIPLTIIFIAAFGGVALIGKGTYEEAPPLANFVKQDGTVIISNRDLIEGKIVFQQNGLMDYGSMFGDGAGRGPDFTADALHRVYSSMKKYYTARLGANGAEASVTKVREELKKNTYNESDNSVTISDAAANSYEELVDYYQHLYNIDKIKTKGNATWVYIPDTAEIRKMTAFFYWGAWACATERPGETYSYTHNWPFDPDAGNQPSHDALFWSLIGLLGLIVVLGLVLYYYSQFDKLNMEAFTKSALPLITLKVISNFKPTPSQKSAFKFLFVGLLLFLVQVLFGVLTINDFVNIFSAFGINWSTLVPFAVARGLHVQLSVLWISSCWIGASFFVLPLIAKKEVPHQKFWVELLFWLTLVDVLLMVAGIYLGATGKLGAYWYLLGDQGWEYLEMGKLWQTGVLIVFILWAYSTYRGLKPAFIKGKPWRLPNWLLYTIISVISLFVAGFVSPPEANFAIADFWRWVVVHMWVEAFFEVFTTVIIGYFMVLMGLVSRQSAERVIYIGAILFLGSGLLGVSHNFYWNAKPEATIALGSVFSTLQVIPLILLTLEAVRFRQLPDFLNKSNGEKFAMNDIFLFLLGVNFWNFFGAGVFGLIINLPILNYYQHGTYLGVNHGHAALMGVYGNLSVAGVLFCSKLLFKDNKWNEKLLRTVFWALNTGLLLMVVLDLFPVGIYQLDAVFKHGLWYAKSQEFLATNTFQVLTWLRMIGGAVFILFGVLPLIWFMVTRVMSLKKSSAENANDALFSEE